MLLAMGWRFDVVRKRLLKSMPWLSLEAKIAAESAQLRKVLLLDQAF